MLLIDVDIETAPTWVVSDAEPVECAADAQPDPAETGGTLTWALLDENEQPVNWATFDPNDSQIETTLFSVSTSDSGPFTLRVGYAVDVASGVESTPGKKDKALMQAFIRKAKGLEV